MRLRHAVATLENPGDEGLVLDPVLPRETQRTHAAAVEGFKQRLTLVRSVLEAAVATGADDRLA